MKPIVLDWETYYDKDYTLRKITTPEYIMGQEFLAYGVAYSDLDSGESGWVEHADTKEFLLDSKVNSRAMIAHNAQFDSAIMHWRYGVKAKLYICTQQMAYAVLMNRIDNFELDSLAKHYGLSGKIVGALDAVKGKRVLTEQEKSNLIAYAIRDAKLTAQLYYILKKEFPVSQWRTMHWHIKQFAEPILTTYSALMVQALEEEQEEMDQLLHRNNTTLKELRSDAQFAVRLKALGIDPLQEISPTTGKMKYGFNRQNAKFMALAEEHHDHRVSELCQLRLAAKSTIKTSRMQRMTAVGQVMGEKLPIAVKYSGARTTHRPSGTDKVNHLNMPKGSAIREAVRPPRGCVLGVFDLSGAELRVCRTLTGDANTIRLIARGEDVYVAFARDLVGEEAMSDPDSQEYGEYRFVGKVSELSLQYGTGWQKLIHTCWTWARVRLTPDDAKRAVKLFRFRRHKAVWSYWKYIENQLFFDLSLGRETTLKNAPFIGVEHERLILPSGLWLDYPNLRQRTDEKGRTQWVTDKAMGRNSKQIPNNMYGGKAVEQISQTLTNECMNTMRDRIEDAGIRVAHSVYDEVVCVVPRGREDHVRDEVVSAMTTPMEWWPELDLAVEGGFADNYAAAK